MAQITDCTYVHIEFHKPVTIGMHTTFIDTVYKVLPIQIGLKSPVVYAHVHTFSTEATTILISGDSMLLY